MRRNRFVLVMGMWFIFTVFIGTAAPIIPQVIYGQENTFGIISIFSGGELFIASAVIAADAIGRFFRVICFVRFNVEARRERWWSYGGVIASIVCLWVVAQYSLAVVAFRQSNVSTQIAPFAYTSLRWFLVTAIAAGLTIAGAEALLDPSDPG